MILLSATGLTPAAAKDLPMWSATTLPGFPPYGGEANVISCVSTSYCVALDRTGDAWKFNGTSWSGPVATGIGDQSVDPDNIVVGVSCANKGFCLAVDSTAHYVAFNGSTWSTPNQAAPGATLTGVSCPEPSFCFASQGDGSSGFVFNNQALFVKPAPPQPASVATLPMSAVSCRNVTFCMVVGQDYAESFNGGNASWSTPYTFSPMGDADLGSVSCATKIFCIAGADDNSGDTAWIFNGSSWSETGLASGTEAIHGVSCPRLTFCMVVDDQGQAFTYAKDTWSPGVLADPTTPGEPIYGLSCVSKSFCAASDNAPTSSGEDNHILTFSKSP